MHGRLRDFRRSLIEQGRQHRHLVRGADNRNPVSLLQYFLWMRVRNHAVAADDGDDGGACLRPDRRFGNRLAGELAVALDDLPNDFELRGGTDQFIEHARASRAWSIDFVESLAPHELGVTLDLTDRQVESEER